MLDSGIPARDLPEAVARLARSGGNDAFLSAHHLEAARRLAVLFERARLTPRVTMSYDPARVAGRAGRGSAPDDMATGVAEARARLNGLARQMPPDCWHVLFDVCGLDRGLQEIETTRGWPRRGGKLVLRIALSQLCALYGLDAEAAGAARGRGRHWLGERPPLFAPAADF